jgi:RHS repeat-associated protein
MRTAWGRCVRRVGRLRGRVAGGEVLRSRLSWIDLVALPCFVLALILLPSARGNAETTTGRPGSADVTTVRELPELRTETSSTFVRSDGGRVARISRTPVNYRDSSGNWQPISTTLQPGANGGLAASATQLPVKLPSSLSSPVTVGSDGAAVSFTLEGAGGAAAASGSTASYAEALPSVSASYEEQATRLKETLNLANAAAPTVYHYHLSTTGGLSAKLINGTVVFSDAQGHARYVMPAPSLADLGATGRPDTRDIHYSLSEDGAQLDLVVSSAWLQSPDRAFPVKVDPTVEYWGDNVDCFIASEPTYENTSLCGTYIYLGHHESPSSAGRGLLRFELGTAIPEDSTILSANLRLTDSYTATSSQTIEVDGLEKTPTNSATWNKYDGTNAWTTKGGDYETGSPSKQTIAPTGSGHVFSWGITSLLEKWVREPSTNHGLLVRAENETSGESSWVSDSGEAHPYIEVFYSPKVGSPSDSTFTSQQLGDRQGLSVNVANGNVVLQNHILELPGIGYDLSINAFYNNLEYSWRNLGMSSSLSTGQDVRMEYNEVEGSWAFADPSGAWWRFQREPAGDKEGKKAFKPPFGLNAKLTEEASGSLVLEYVTARVKYYFDSNKHPSFLQKIEDANKNTTTMHYNSEGISSIEDTHGHSITFKHEKAVGEYVSSIKDALGRKWEFAHNSKGQLESIKDPDLHKSKYTYNEADDLTQIEDPNKNKTELSYSSRNQITEIRHVVNGTASKAGTKDVITTFNYERPAKSSLECPSGSSGDTEVVSPNGSPEGKANSSSTGHKTFYCFNARDEVTKTMNQRGGVSTAGYDAASGNLTKYQNPGDTAEGGTVKNTIAYNPSGAATKISDGTGTSTTLDTTLAYGGGTGNGGQVEPSSVRTPYSAPKQKETGAHRTFYGYDSSGNVTSARQDKEIEGEGQPEAKLAYNGKGQVTESTDPNGNTTKYEYDAKNDLVKITPPSPAKSPLGATTLTYDALDRVHTAEDGRKVIATYTYDGEDRVTKVEYSDGSSVSFKFDADGNTTEREDAKGFGEPYTGVTLYEYDKLNRPTLETTPTAKSTRYGYDYDGNLTSLEDAGGTVAYAYGSDDLLTGLTEPENSAHPFKFGYEAGVDNRESTTYPNGLLQCTNTDPGGRLTKLLVFKPTGEQNCKSEPALSSTLESYGLLYSLKFEEEGHEEAIDTPDVQTLFNYKAENTTTYHYDTLDRLLGAVVTNSGGTPLTSEYEYDNTGNMLLNHTYSPSTTYTNEHMKYNEASEICAIATTTPSECASPSEPGIAGQPTYDTVGEMTSDGLLSGANKFAYTARDQLSSITPHGESAKQVVSHGTGQNDLAAIGSEEVIQNVLGVGVTGSGESAKYYTRGSEGALLAKRTAKGKPSETEYFLRDSFGSVALLTSSSGLQTAPSSGSYQYDPYGSPIGAAPATFGYGSGQTLPGGVVHYGARYYDPMLGSWTQPDASEGYGYAGGDPINESDSNGLCPFDRSLSSGYTVRGNYTYVDICGTRGKTAGKLVGFVRFSTREIKVAQSSGRKLSSRIVEGVVGAAVFAAGIGGGTLCVVATDAIGALHCAVAGGGVAYAGGQAMFNAVE